MVKKFGVLLILACIVFVSIAGCTSKVNQENHVANSEDKTYLDTNIDVSDDKEDDSTEDVKAELEEEMEKEPKPEVNEETPSQQIPSQETPSENTDDKNTGSTNKDDTSAGGTNTGASSSGNAGEKEKPQKPAYPYYIKVNRLANCVTIYTKDENGAYTVPVKAMICSVGKNINSTPTGVFTTSDKYEWRKLFANVGYQYGQYAIRITGHILFHSVPYTQQSKDTLNTNYYNNLGIADSMGCIRLTCEDAKWLYDNCASGTTVEIYDSEDPGPLGKPTAIKIDVNSPYAGWDPTDPDSSNPWKNQELNTTKSDENKAVSN